MLQENGLTSPLPGITKSSFHYYKVYIYIYFSVTAFFLPCHDVSLSVSQSHMKRPKKLKRIKKRIVCVCVTHDGRGHFPSYKLKHMLVACKPLV